MKVKQRAFDFQMKALDTHGVFSGYGSVFDVIDSYREVVAPGAFAKSLEKWKEKDRLPPMLYQHRAGEPIGAYTLMREDTKGLYVEGQLLVDDIQRAREVYALMKAKALSGMSIGFNVVEDAYDSRAGIYTLNQVDLWEVSIVTFPANEAAGVESVKDQRTYAAFERLRADNARGVFPSIRDFEEAMREAGYSKQDATAIASLSIGKLRRDAASNEATPAELLASVTLAIAAATSDLSIADSLRG